MLMPFPSRWIGFGSLNVLTEMNLIEEEAALGILGTSFPTKLPNLHREVL